MILTLQCHLFVHTICNGNSTIYSKMGRILSISWGNGAQNYVLKIAFNDWVASFLIWQKFNCLIVQVSALHIGLIFMVVFFCGFKNFSTFFFLLPFAFFMVFASVKLFAPGKMSGSYFVKSGRKIHERHKREIPFFSWQSFRQFSELSFGIFRWMFFHCTARS